MGSLIYKKTCKVCHAVKDQPKLRTRIDRSSHYIPSATDSLRQIYSDHSDQFSYPSLLNHCKKHQFPNAKEITSAEKRAVSTRKQATYNDVWDSIIQQGHAAIENGDLKVENINQLLMAARDKSNYEKNKQDHSLALMDMVFRFSAGEVTGEILDGNPNDRPLSEGQEVAGGPANGPEQGSSQEPLGPRDFYQSLTGDAAARRPGEVLEGNSSPKD